MFAAFNDPEKFVLTREELHLTVKKYGVSVDRAMRLIGKDSRVLSRFCGIYHLKRTDPDMYVQVRYQAVHLMMMMTTTTMMMIIYLWIAS